MLILGIETSCDETAMALVRHHEDGSAQVVCELVSSQIEIHQAYGGVVPEIAAREHMTVLPLLLAQTMSNAQVTQQQIDGIAVTSGPGLKGCLLAGICFAKGLSLGWEKPIYGINHIEGHALVPFLDNSSLQFPALALIVSGGHTELQIIHAPGKYECVARTIDDAAGEAFDKSAHLLGFSYPGGAKLAACADEHKRTSYQLPRVMREADGFSFSGLKTAIWQLVNREKDKINSGNVKAEICVAVQNAIVDALTFKLSQAVKQTGIHKIIITGGVAANSSLRKAAEALKGVELYYPSTAHCSDNATMIAYAAGYRARNSLPDSLDLNVMPRWPLETVRYTT